MVDMIDFLGSRSSDGLYIQYRVFRYSKGANIPISTFWSDRAPSKIDSAKVYFYSPGLRHYAKQIVLGSYVLWLDFDDLEDWRQDYHVEPSLIVSTGGGFHVYWKMQDFLDFDTISLMLKRLISIYPAADPLCSDPTRFLRWPGSYNVKYNPARLVKPVFETGKVYSVRSVYG
jgi:hypothetical protein